MIKKSISLILTIILSAVTVFPVETFALDYNYAIDVDSYVLNFVDTFQQNIFTTNQKSEIDWFNQLLSTAWFTKSLNTIAIVWSKIDNMYFKVKKVVNWTQVNGKSLDYFIKKYNWDPNNFSDTTFIENMVRQNIPNNNNKNYAPILLIISKLKTKYNNVPLDNSTFSTIELESAAKILYDIYRGQLGPMDNFNYKVAKEMLDKLNTNRGNYLKPNDYTWNVSRLNADYDFITNFVSGKYITNITNTYNNMFVYSSVLNIWLTQSVLTSIQLKFFAYQKTNGTDVEFINPITGIMNDWDKFNAQTKNYFVNNLIATKTDILSNINSLNWYETSSGWTYTGSTSSLNTITSIVDTATWSLVYSWTSTAWTINWGSLLSNITDFSTLNQTSLDWLYKQELDQIKKKDVDFLQKNKSFLSKEKAKLQYLLGGTTQWQAILSTLINASTIVSDSDVIDTVQTQLDTTQIDTVISDSINTTFNINTDPVNDIFTKAYKKHKILSINNPLVWSEFIVPPLTMSIVDSPTYRNALNGIDWTLLSNYRSNYWVSLTTVDATKRGFANISFSYSPSPIILADPTTGDNIWIQLGNRKTYYSNKSIDITLNKDDYALNLYAINNSFKNVKIFFNWQRINLGWLMNLNSTGNVKVTFNENHWEQNFMPALWIKWLIQ